MTSTKNFYVPATNIIQQSQPQFSDLGYSLDIPWNDVYTAGWIYEKPDVWGQENRLITKPNPEYYAPDNVIKSNIIPAIDVNDPVYHFDRKKYTYKLY